MVHQNDDYWAITPDATEQIALSEGVSIETLSAAPLDQQFGAAPMAYIPSTLAQTFSFDKPNLFAILDATSLEGLSEQLEGAGIIYRCLFNGNAEQELSSVAPYLVQLHDDTPLLRKMFTRASFPQDWWDREAFILMQSDANIDDVLKHLRRFVYILDESGAGMYFRFWNSRILLKLMTTVAHDFPDPILLFGSGSAHCIKSFVIPDPLADTVTIATPMAISAARPFKSSPRLMEVLRDHAREQFGLKLISHCAPRFPETFERLKHEQKAAMMADVIAMAERLNLTKHGPVTSFAEMRLVLGIGMHNDPMYPWLSSALSRVAEQNQMDQMEDLVGVFSRYLQAVNGPNNAAFFKALKRAEITLDAPKEASYLDMLARVFPEKFKAIGTDVAQAFLIAIRDQLSSYPNLDAQSTRAYILLCYFMGHRCLHDPQYMWIAPALERSAQGGDANSALVRKCHTWLAAIFKKEAA